MPVPVQFASLDYLTSLKLHTVSQNGDQWHSNLNCMDKFQVREDGYLTFLVRIILILSLSSSVKDQNTSTS